MPDGNAFQRGKYALVSSAVGRMPEEILDRIGLLAAQTLRDLWTLSAVCVLFRRRVVPNVTRIIIYAFLSSFGISKPTQFLAFFQSVGGLVSGPSLLAMFFPGSLNTAFEAGFCSRLELHIPGTSQAVAVVKKLLENAGYTQMYRLEHDNAVLFAQNVLGYLDFGRTVPLTFNFTRKTSQTSSQECTVFVNDSRFSALTSVLEQPTTLFMNYIQDGSLHVLYPNLTLNGKGLVNAIHHEPLSIEGRTHPNGEPWTDDEAKTAMDWFVTRMNGTDFVLERKLDAFQHLTGHICKVDPSCPRTVRWRGDGYALQLPFGNVRESDGVKISWALKARWTCVWRSEPSPWEFRENFPVCGKYEVNGKIYGDTQLYWETGDEDGVGFFLKGRHEKDPVKLYFCEAAEERVARLELQYGEKL